MFQMALVGASDMLSQSDGSSVFMINISRFYIRSYLGSFEYGKITIHYFCVVLFVRVNIFRKKDNSNIKQSCLLACLAVSNQNKKDIGEET